MAPALWSLWENMTFLLCSSRFTRPPFMRFMFGLSRALDLVLLPRRRLWRKRTVRGMLLFVRGRFHRPVSNREGLGTSRLLWDKQHETHVVSKSTLKLAIFSCLVFIREIQPSKNSKIYQEICRRRTVCPAIHTSLINFQGFEWLCPVQ